MTFDTYGIMVLGPNTIGVKMAGLGELLRIVPGCEVRKCRRNGPIMMLARHPKRELQRASLCAVHLPEMVRLVEQQGYTVTILGADYDAGVGDLDSSG